MKNLNEKVVWITGASSGIGEAIAKSIAKHQTKLILSARRIEELNNVKSEIEKQSNNKIEILPFDLNNPDEVRTASEKAINIFGKIDVLINNGGISQRSMAIDTSMDVYRQLMEINYFSAVQLTKAVLPGMIDRLEGHIVTISSVVGKFGSPLRTGYSAAKHALHGYFDSLRAEVFDNNISITLVTPGFIRTNISINAVTGVGGKFGKMDDGQKNGISAESCAVKIVKGITSDKHEILVGGKETISVYINRFFPGIFGKIIRKRKV